MVGAIERQNITEYALYIFKHIFTAMDDLDATSRVSLFLKGFWKDTHKLRVQRKVRHEICSTSCTCLKILHHKSQR